MSDMIPAWATQLREHDTKHRFGELVGHVAYDAYRIRDLATWQFKAELANRIEQLVGHREGVSVLPSYHKDKDQWRFSVFALKVPRIQPVQVFCEVDSVPPSVYA